MLFNSSSSPVFTTSLDFSCPIKEKFIETSVLYVDVEGLLRKNYIADIEKGFAGGVYTFSTIENAKEWFSEDRIKWITERYSKPEIEYYERPVIVDNEKNKIIS